MRLRQIAPVGLVLGLTLAGFLGARALGERDARHDSERRADVAAAEIRGHVVQGAALAESLRRFMVSVADGGVTKEQFEGIASSWLSPAGLAGAAWIEQVPASRRATYERRIGRPIVTRDRRGTVAPVPPRSSYLPATLVSGIAPMVLAGLDLGSESGMTAAVARERTLFDVSATPLATLRDGTRGFFLVKSAQRLGRGTVEPGFVVLFVPESWLRAAATDTPRLQLTVGGTSSGDLEGVPAVRSGFTEAGQRFEVVVPRRSVQAAAAVMPWIILVSGFVLALLVGALGINAARRASAQRELDRIFSLSHDLVTVADFDGHFRRVNPAVESILGYTEEEFLSRPYLDFVHPDDRERTAAQAAALSRGQTTVSFENRFVRKDGSHRWLEWTATPVVEERATYSVARDVTERRKAEAEVERLADEQAALRRVATLVARDASQAELFTAIAQECANLFGTEDIGMIHYEGDRNQLVLASAGTFSEIFPAGSRQPLGGENASSRVFRTGRPARIDDYGTANGPIADAVRPTGLRDAVATPITVEGRLWGAMITGTTGEEPLPPETESRLGQFTELMATAIANTESRARVRRLTEEQAALRRVATLVAEGASPSAVFNAVGAEMEELLGADRAVVCRYEPGAELTVLAHRGSSEQKVPPGAQINHDGDCVEAVVRRTERPARIEDFEKTDDATAEAARAVGASAAVGAPIVVDGRLWGVIAVSWHGGEPPPADTEERMAQFAELLDTAIANADSRDQLAASRARLLTEADEARRRVVRDLHDGAQQRLVHTIITLKLAQRAFREKDGKAESLIGDALAQAEQGNVALRELAHGILPPILTDGGLRAGVDAMVARLDLPVQVQVPAERFPAEIEASAYFIVAEALTNVVKHSQAERAEVRGSVEDGMLRVEVRDDGIGGADPGGHGLVGMADRVTALGGRLSLESPAGGGTLVAARLPLSAG